MKTRVTVVTVALLSGVGLAVSVADVSGTSNLEMKWSTDSNGTRVCTFKQEGDNSPAPAAALRSSRSVAGLRTTSFTGG